MSDKMTDDGNSGGIGGNLFDRKVNERSDIKLIKRAISQGWPISEQVRAKVVAAMESIVDKSPEERNVVAAAKVLVAADSVNVRRETNDISEAHGPNSVNVNVTQVVAVKEDEAWYGNVAHRLASETSAAPAADTPLSKPNEGSGLRPSVGKNGHGAVNGHSGPRPAP